MKSSPTMRVLMAAGMYLLLMWGYVALQTPQLYAVFTALIMSIALLFWVNEARYGEVLASDGKEPASPQPVAVEAGHSNDPTLAASIARLDSLKADLTQQYAQFGQDQSLLNSRGLGTWHQGGRSSGGKQ